jgi:dolichyl-phosphate beta-glucosyltransferase
MLAESAPCAPGTSRRNGPGIRVVEVPIGWKEVGGSKLNVLWASVEMAWHLALLRASWLLGVYRRR